MSSPPIYSESQMQAAIAETLREERARVAFHKLPLALQVFPRDVWEDEPEHWESVTTGEVTLPAGEYYVGDVAAQLPEEEDGREDGFYESIQEDGTRAVYGTFKTMNGDHIVGGSKKVWIDYERFGIMPADRMSDPDNGWRNGVIVKIGRSFTAGFNKETRSFWLKVPEDANNSFSVKMLREEDM